MVILFFVSDSHALLFTGDDHADESTRAYIEKYPLCYATIEKDMDGINQLMNEGKDINEKDCNGKTPFHYAVEFGHEDIVKFFLPKADKTIDSGVLVRSSLFAGQTYYTIFKMLLENKFKIENDDTGLLLQELIKRGDDKSVAMYIKYMQDVNHTERPFDQTPLHTAAFLADVSIVKLLLNNNAAVDAIDNRGYTPLDWAIVARNFEAVRLFLIFGKGLTSALRNRNKDDFISVEFKNYIRDLAQRKFIEKNAGNKKLAKYLLLFGLGPVSCRGAFIDFMDSFHIKYLNKEKEIAELLQDWKLYERYIKRELESSSDSCFSPQASLYKNFVMLQIKTFIKAYYSPNSPAYILSEDLFQHINYFLKNNLPTAQEIHQIAKKERTWEGKQ